MEFFRPGGALQVHLQASDSIMAELEKLAEVAHIKRRTTV